MKSFDVIRMIIVTIPTGMFTTYLFFIAIVHTLKVRKVDEIARRLMTVYSVLAGVSGVILPVFYFMPDIFVRWSILYCALAAYTMIVYYHFLYYAARLKKCLTCYTISSLPWLVRGCWYGTNYFQRCGVNKGWIFLFL
ncbi:MAG: hypothetical protein LUD15_11775 [Bacteroides sp.]|nr:hypothetical protein [Bacteroides sp.]